MKLQPNFSWQKYEGKPEDQKEQFQFQLQQQHILVANAINTTINDLSFFSTERETAFTWVDNKRIWTKTVPTSVWTSGGTINTIPMGITKAGQTLTITNIVCALNNANITLMIPHTDVTTPANAISMTRSGDNIIFTSGGSNFSAFSGYVTIYYTRA